MAEAHATQKLIYLSLREIFVGVSAQIRKKKTIKRILEQHKQKPHIRDLIRRGYDIDRITIIAQTLLQEKIFESTKEAEARFPEAFGKSATSDVAPKMSQSNVETSGVTATETVKPKSADENHNKEKNAAGKPDIQTTDIKSQPQILPETSKLTISSDSVYLPFWHQYRIMVQVQTTLEKACFNFASRSLGDVLENNAWDCAEAIELHTWPKILLKHQDIMDWKPPEDVKKSLPDLLVSITQIRHTAVHRLRLPAKSILDLTKDAEALAKLLQDNTSIEIISTICQHVSVAIEDLEETKRLLELRLVEIDKEYTEKRIQLALEEAAMIESAKEESKENDFFANANPDDALDALIAGQKKWKQRGSVSISPGGPEETHALETEAAYDPILSVEKRAEPNGSCTAPAESHPKLDEERGCLVEDLNADSLNDMAMSTKTCATNGDHPKRPKAVAMFDQSDLCLRAYAADSLPKPSNSFHSPSTSECEYWATPCGSRSPIEETPAVNGFKHSTATSE